MKEILITDLEKGQRADKFLLKYLNKATKTFVYKMIRKKNIKLNDKKLDGSEILTSGDRIKIFFSDETLLQFQEEKKINLGAGKLSIVFEDENILICNKPTGLLVHAENRTDDDTLMDRILAYLYKNGAYDISKTSVFTPAICNRLDRNTSGIVVSGKNLQSVQELNAVFANNKIDKYYSTIVKGSIGSPGVLKGYLKKNERDNRVEIFNSYISGSVEIITEYEPVKTTDDFTQLKIKLITGKSHQIRAHLKSIGHPVLGDRKYGDEDINAWLKTRFGVYNQLLHGEKIVFKENTGYLGYLYEKEFCCKAAKLFYKVTNELFTNWED